MCANAMSIFGHDAPMNDRNYLTCRRKLKRKKVKRKKKAAPNLYMGRNLNVSLKLCRRKRNARRCKLIRSVSRHDLKEKNENIFFKWINMFI